MNNVSTHKPPEKSPMNKQPHNNSNTGNSNQTSIHTSDMDANQNLHDSDNDLDDSSLAKVANEDGKKEPKLNNNQHKRNKTASQPEKQTNQKKHQNKAVTKQETNQNMYTIDPDIMSIAPGTKKPLPQTSQSYDHYMNLMGTQNDAYFINMNKKIVELNDTIKYFTELAGTINPFRILGFYKELPLSYFNSSPGAKPNYEKMEFNIRRNPSYCDYADMYNLFNPTNALTKINFFADYTTVCNASSH